MGGGPGVGRRGEKKALLLGVGGGITLLKSFFKQRQNRGGKEGFWSRGVIMVGSSNQKISSGQNVMRGARGGKHLLRRGIFSRGK